MLSSRFGSAWPEIDGREEDLDDEGIWCVPQELVARTPQSSFRESCATPAHRVDDPVYAEAAISLNDYDISLKILVITELRRLDEPKRGDGDHGTSRLLSAQRRSHLAYDASTSRATSRSRRRRRARFLET